MYSIYIHITENLAKKAAHVHAWNIVVVRSSIVFY